MDRVVTEYVVDGEGILTPIRAGAWRVERAIGESGLHRRLAALARTPAAISRAASTFGPLRLRADLLSLFPDGVWDEVGVVTGQASEPDWADVRGWVARDCRGPMPPALRQAMPLIQVLAAMPAPLRAYGSLVMEGASGEALSVAATEAEQALGQWDAMAPIGELMNAIDRVAAAGGPLAAAEGLDPIAGPTPCEDDAMAWAVGMYGSVIDLLAGHQAPPPGLDPSGSFGAWLGAMPDLLRPLETLDGGETVVGRLISQLRTESIDDWVAVADEMALWVAAIDVRKRADLGTLKSGDADILRGLVAVLLDGVSEGLEGATTPGELAGRVLPRLELRLRRRLEQIRAWPCPADRPVGTYGRALWSVWSELTDERPPHRCAVPSCPSTFPAHGNRRYCDSHRRSRDRQRKRAATLAPNRPLGVGEA